MQEETNQTSADIIIIDALPPEEGAMSQALYSRKPDSILKHLLRLSHDGVQNFMGTYYSDYGHNSIGDCGSTTLYFENVSMLAAKAIQNFPLYNGQEASTRYLDFSGRIMINPLAGQLASKYVYVQKTQLENTASISTIQDDFKTIHEATENGSAGITGKYIQEKWMDFYQNNMPIVKNHVANLHPIKPDQTKGQYDKAVNARAFDIMRGLIPAGMTTMVSWHSNIRQLRDRLAILKYHPTAEVSALARTAITGLCETYPASFTTKHYPEAEKYLEEKAKKTSYFEPLETDTGECWIDGYNFNEDMLKKYFVETLRNRPAKCELPNEIGEAGTISVSFKIDFGSFRDAQRHRKGVCKMPLLTTTYGFHQWYLDQLPEQVRRDTLRLIEELEPLINSLPCSDAERQYYIPMGYIVLADFTWSFDQCVYVAELRSSETVHPTFRVHAQALGKWIKQTVPYAALHVDYNEDKWSYKRGAQDIKEKKTAM